MQIFLTILAGVGTFVLGQIVMKLFIDPVQSFKSTIAEISNALILYANVYANPRPASDESQSKMSQEMRMLSSKLQANMYLIPSYKYTSILFRLPSIDKVVSASGNLIFLHNGHSEGPLHAQGTLNCYAAQRAKLALGIFIPEDQLLKPEREKELIKAKEDTQPTAG